MADIAVRERSLGITEATRRSYHRRYVLGRIGLYVLAVLFALIAAGPFVWSLITAFKLNADLYNVENNPFLFNEPLTASHLVLLFRDTPFLMFTWNTLWVGTLVVLITLVLGLPAAYSLARLDRPWAGWFGVMIFMVYLVPRPCCSCRCPGWWWRSGYRIPPGHWFWCIPQSPFRSRSGS